MVTLVGLAFALVAPVAQLAPADDPFPVAEPLSVGVTPQALTQLADEIRGLVARDTIVGAELLVIKKRRTIMHEAFGWRDRDDRVPMARHTIFNIRSMSKPLTGAAIQMLIDDGELEVTDPLAQHLECFDRDKSRAITVQEVLSHRGGLPLTMVTKAIDQYPDLRAMACAAAEAGPEFPPGSKFWYSDAGTDVLGALVEKLAGENLALFLSERLFQPLGMTDTLHLCADDDARWSRVASLYIGRPGQWQRFWKPAGKPFYPFAWGSQSVYSTPRDYARFLAMWMDRGRVGEDRVLSEAAIARTLTPVCEMSQLGSDARFPSGFADLETYYGQMAVVYADPKARVPVVIGHSGSDGTWAWAWPGQDLMVLYFTQSRGQATGIRLERIIDQQIARRVSGPLATATVPDDFEPYIGTYRADFAAFRDEPWSVFYERGHLMLDIPSQIAVALAGPDSEHWFALVGAAGQKLKFKRDDQGRIAAMSLREGAIEYVLPRLGFEPKPPSYGEDVRRYVGRFRATQAAITIDVRAQDGWLIVDWPGETAYELLPPDQNGAWMFCASRDRALVFEDDGKRVTSVTYRHPGGTIVMPRVGDGE